MKWCFVISQLALADLCVRLLKGDAMYLVQNVPPVMGEMATWSELGEEDEGSFMKSIHL